MIKALACAAITAGVAWLSVAHAGAALPVAKHTFAKKTKLTDISIDYPVTGVKAIDDDIRLVVAERARQFRSLAQGDYLEGQGAYVDVIDYEIARNDGKVFAVVWNETADFHGAHPSNDIFTANYLLPDGWRVYLPEIVDGERAFKKISALAIPQIEKQLEKEGSLGDEEEIQRGASPDAINFKEFVLQRDHLHIEFPDEQVAPHAAGPQQADIPLAALATMIRPDWRAPQASFPCAKAATPLEKAICSNALLARLDREVAETYFQHIGWSKAGYTATKVEALKAEQRAWLRSRDAACAGKAGQAGIGCLMTLYSKRLAALERMTE